MTKEEKYLIKVKENFNKVGYFPSKSEVDFDDLFNSGAKTLNHTVNFLDGIQCCEIIKDLNSQTKRISNLILKNQKFWQSIKNDRKARIETVILEKAFGVYHIQNIIEKSKNRIFVSSVNFEKNTFYEIENNKKVIHIDNPYRQRYYKIMPVLEDCRLLRIVNSKTNQEILTLAFDLDKKEFYFKNNKTNFKIANEELGIFVVKGDILKEKKPSALIMWAVSEIRDSGIARLEVFEGGIDLELLLSIAMGTFMIFNNIEKSKMQTLGVLLGLEN